MKAVNTSSVFLENLATGTLINMMTPYSDNNIYWDGAFNSRINTNWGGSVGTPYLWTGWNNNSLTPKTSFRRNGLQLISGSTLLAYTGNNSAMNVGANAYNGRIGEIIYNTNALSAVERQRIESYLAIKYGFTLDQTTPQNYLASDASVVWNATMNTGYNNNIAGIARDDVSGLNQKVSRSVNTGSVLTIATNGDFTSANSTVSRTNITNNLSALVVGDDNASATARVTTNVASGFNTRVTRLWKVQNTNYTQAVSLQFSGLDHANLTWNLVWKAADANFTTGSTTLGTLNSSGQITIPAGIGSGFLSLQANALDSDGDGVVDIDDLDDDNDGILDVNETQINTFVNGNLENSTTGWSVGTGWNYAVSQGNPGNCFNIGGSINASISQTLNFSGTLATASTATLKFDFYADNFYLSPVSFDVIINGITFATITRPTSATQYNITTFNGASCNLSTMPLSIWNTLVFSIPTGSLVNSSLFQIYANFSNSDDPRFDNFVFYIDNLDTDGDGITNSLDLDSDNDGCVDAIEGAAGITSSQLVTASGSVTVGTGSTASNQNLGTTVNANGVPQFVTVPSGYSNTTGQAVGISQNASFNGCIAPGGVIAGLTSWNKENTANTGSIWKNSANINDATGTGTNVYNTSGADLINFNPSYTFNTSGKFTLPSALDLSGSYSVFGVSKLKNAGSNGRVFGSALSNVLIGYWSNLMNTVFYDSAPNSLTSGTNSVIASTTDVRNYTYIRNAGPFSFYGNSTSILTGATSGATAFRGDIGGSNNENSNVIVPEFITYNVALDAVSQNRVESYLAIKYGYTKSGDYVLSSGTISWNTTANTGYNNNIAGIARDDVSGLNQKQSASVNPGVQPVIGNVNITDTNANNTNNFSADLSALVWGSDTGSTSFGSSFAFGGLNARMTRIWKVQETGTVGTVKVALPASQIGSNIAQLNLVVSADATFDGSDTRTAMTLETLGGVQYYTATVDFTTGQFFSFAAFAIAPGGVSSGLSLWFDASSGTFSDAGITPGVNNGKIQQWNNRAGNINVPFLSMNLAAKQPDLKTNLVNFNSAIEFAGTTSADEEILTTTTLLSNLFSSNTNSGFITFDTAGIFFTANYLNTANRYDMYGNSGQFGGTNFTPSGSIGAYNILSFVGNTTSNLASLNGNLPYSSVTRTVDLNTNITTDFSIGGRPDGGLGNVTNRIGEVINYTRVLTNTELTQVHSYLSIKYGTTLGSTSTTRDYLASNGTTTFWTGDTTYQNNIAGITRDDVSGLNQKVSRSVNSSSVLTLATNADFTSANSAGSRTAINNDLSALLVGDDNASATARVTTNLASGFNTRITRLWKIQNTNYTQAVSLQFSGLDHTNFTWNLVWKAADANFTTGSTTLGTLNSSGQITVPAGIGSGFLSLQALGVDSDSDGVLNIEDLDDDNDGILDTAEACEMFPNGTFDTGIVSGQLSGWTSVAGNVAIGGSAFFNGGNTIPNGVLYNDITLTSGANYTLNYACGRVGDGFGANVSLLVEVINRDTNTVIASKTTIRNQSDGPPAPTNESLSFVATSPNIRVRFTDTSPGSALSIDISLDNVSLINSSCDTDGDGITNTLDLDSDNDGCVDAIEGGAGITTSQLVTAGGSVTVGTGSTASNQNLGTTVNANGVPQFVTVPSGYSNTTGQAMGTSQVANTAVTGTASSDQTINANTAPAALALTGSSGGTFQWQVSSDNITFSDISGATTATYSPGILTATRYFRVSVSSPGGCQFISNTVTITVNSFCYKPAATVGTTLDSKHGITALGRAGAVGDNWPMVRKGAWTVLESKTKGFVINRLTAAQIAAIPPANLVEGMMIYDTTNNCMKIYTSTDGGTTFGWECFSTQTCPD
jgi:hypothetical protein